MIVHQVILLGRKLGEILMSEETVLSAPQVQKHPQITLIFEDIERRKVWEQRLSENPWEFETFDFSKLSEKSFQLNQLPSCDLLLLEFASENTFPKDFLAQLEKSKSRPHTFAVCGWDGISNHFACVDGIDELLPRQLDARIWLKKIKTVLKHKTREKKFQAFQKKQDTFLKTKRGFQELLKSLDLLRYDERQSPTIFLETLCLQLQHFFSAYSLRIWIKAEGVEERVSVGNKDIPWEGEIPESWIFKVKKSLRLKSDKFPLSFSAWLDRDVHFLGVPLFDIHGDVFGTLSIYCDKLELPECAIGAPEEMIGRYLSARIANYFSYFQLRSSYEQHNRIAEFNTQLLTDFRLQQVEEMSLYRRTLDQMLSIKSDDNRPTYALVIRQESERLVRALPFSRDANQRVVVMAPALSSFELLDFFVSKKMGQIYNQAPYPSDLPNQTEFPLAMQRLFGRINSFVCCPLHPIKGHLGFIVLFNYGRPVHRADAAILLSYAVPLGFQISITRENQDRQRTQLVAMSKLAELAEKRDNETGDHLIRMSQYCRILSEDLAAPYSPYKEQIDTDFIHEIREASPLHDIGKVGIEDRILLKPGALTPEEYEIMKTHTTIGAQVLEGVDFLSMARDIALSHHEKFDGTGYPQSLKGYDIPLSARIVALADVYDAITSKRKYRKRSFTHLEARDLILSEYNKHFDPAVVDSFMRCETLFKELRSSYQDSTKFALSFS